MATYEDLGGHILSAQVPLNENENYTFDFKLVSTILHYFSLYELFLPFVCVCVCV